MKTQKMKLYFAALIVLVLFPSQSMAYLSTAQSATRITDTTILYTVTYKFGFLNRELYMPIMATRGLEAYDDSPNAGYTIFDDENVYDLGTATGLILTRDEDVEIRDNQYYLPPGKSAEFTLYTLLTVPENQLDESLDISLQMTRLPFTMIKEGEPIPARLNPSELQYYRTPEIGF